MNARNACKTTINNKLKCRIGQSNNLRSCSSITVQSTFAVCTGSQLGEWRTKEQSCHHLDARFTSRATVHFVTQFVVQLGVYTAACDAVRFAAHLTARLAACLGFVSLTFVLHFRPQFLPAQTFSPMFVQLGCKTQAIDFQIAHVEKKQTKTHVVGFRCGR